MTTERDRTINHLVNRGHDRDFAEYVVDKHPTSLLAATARLNAAIAHFGQLAAKSINDIMRKVSG